MIDAIKVEDEYGIHFEKIVPPVKCVSGCKFGYRERITYVEYAKIKEDIKKASNNYIPPLNDTNGGLMQSETVDVVVD